MVNLPTSSTSHFFVNIDQMGIDNMEVDKVGVDQVGINKMEIDKVGLDKVGINPSCR